MGTVDGFVFDDTGSITHLVLEPGHLWAHRDITTPIECARSATSQHVRLTLSSKDIGDFPSVRFRRPARIDFGSNSFTA